MTTVNVMNASGGAAGTVELDPALFEAEVKPHLFHAEVRRQLAKRRAGTHSTKNRSAVAGGGAKPYRQKGTGRARQGSIRSPQWAGGGSVFGPVPRKYEHKLTKKTRRAALRGAISLRQQEGALIIAEGLHLEAFKTKRVIEMLSAVGVAGESTLLVIAGPEPQLEQSARNLPNVSVLRVDGLNVYDVLRRKKLVIAKDALAAVAGRLQSAEETAS